MKSPSLFLNIPEKSTNCITEQAMPIIDIINIKNFLIGNCLRFNYQLYNIAFIQLITLLRSDFCERVVISVSFSLSLEALLQYTQTQNCRSGIRGFLRLATLAQDRLLAIIAMGN